MEAFALVVVVVVVASAAWGLWMARTPVPWDEYGADLLTGAADAESAGAPSAAEDEAQLRELIARKRAARGATARAPIESAPWSHVDPEVLEEARRLLERRAARLRREGAPPPDLAAELTRLLGPPHL